MKMDGSESVMREAAGAKIARTKYLLEYNNVRTVGVRLTN